MKKKINYLHHLKKKTTSPLVGKRFIGTLDVNRSGKGFVTVENKTQDIIIYPENQLTAMDGDKVQVEITKVSKSGRPEGCVTKIVSHSRSEFVGKLEVSENFAFLVPDDPHIHTDIFIPLKSLKKAQDGDIAVVKVVEWQGKSKNPVGEVLEILTGEERNNIAMKSILTGNGFRIGFSNEILEETEQLQNLFSPEEIKNRKDIREIPTFTIDPKDAKDFDDALSLRVLKNGNVEVGVHIADVSHYVRPGSALDEEAFYRATSVYLPDRVAPMLPERISNELCSLRPNEDKLTFSVIFQLNHKGTIRQFWIGRTIIRSDKRFTYEEAQTIIETGTGQWSEELLLLNEIAQNLRKSRFAKGAINFSSEEVQFQLDEKGIPVGLTIKQSKEANQLIEEFMLLANKKVAAFAEERKFNKNPIPFPYRVHDQPNEEKLAVFAAFASRFGFQFNLNNPKEIAHSFNEMIEKSKGKPEQMVLEQLGIRTMAKAVYSTENIGHYGLGFKDYCHFTSPIRRYPDIMVHRVIAQILENEITPDKKMEMKCKHCSDQERKAMEAEREGNKYKQVEYMQKFIGYTLDAVITGVSAMGFWAETIEQKCEGMVALADLVETDIFEYQEQTFSLIGRRSGLRFQMGDKVKIKVAAANLEKRQIDFSFVSKKK